jgi:hypothetical protein
MNFIVDSRYKLRYLFNLFKLHFDAKGNFDSTFFRTLEASSFTDRVNPYNPNGVVGACPYKGGAEPGFCGVVGACPYRGIDAKMVYNSTSGSNGP